MKILLIILLFLLGFPGAQAQTSGWNSDRLEVLMPPPAENSGSLDVRVYPNPVTDKRVNIELADQSIKEIRIANIAGAEIYIKRFQVPVNKHQVIIGNIPNGVYLLRITSEGNHTRTTKLMIRTP